ncbi:hypothetical protein [Corynebacterium stationis]|uniref:hypothetical protein n=1 Tax=Corynebacterium stationis TaxID=1705 RepID=UPI000A671ABD
MSLSTARKYTRLATVFFGPADSPKVQRDAVGLAEARQLSVEYLEMVNKHAKKLKTRSAAWKLRAELIAYEGTLDEANEIGKQRVTEEGGDKPKQRGVRVARAIDGLLASLIPSAASPTSRKLSTPPLPTATSHVPKP